MPPLDYETMEQMKTRVEALQNQYGESEFNLAKGTDEIISITLDSLERYFSEGQEHIRTQLPKEVQPVTQ